MKKLLSALLVLAVAAACSLAFTSCNNGKDPADTSVNTAKESKAETKAQTEAQTKKETEAQTEAQTEAETLPANFFTEEQDVNPYVDALGAVVDPDNTYADEGPENLFDGLDYKLCSDFDSSVGLNVTFETKYAVKITSMNFMTGGDTGTYPGRNPTHFKFYGSADGGETWTLIIESDLALPAADLETLEEPIKVEGDAAYKNFKIEFTAISEGSILQVSELMLRGMFQEAK